MAAPITNKLFNITPNLRRSYVSLNDLTSWWIYENKVAKLGGSWTIKWTSDGTNGPASDLDNTDRLASPANCATRGTTGSTAQSWYLAQNNEGVQILVTYQGATDDIARVSFSPGGLFTRAGTPTFPPTATDEVVVSAATTIVNATTSADRVMSIWCAADGTDWRCPVFRQNGIASCLSVMKVQRIAPVSTFPVPYVFGNFVRMSREFLNDSTDVATPTYMEMGALAIGAASFRGYGGRVFTNSTSRLARMYGQWFMGSGNGITNGNTLSNGGGAATFASTYCASLGGTGALTWPIHLNGERTANLDGPWGTLIDWHQVITTSITNPSITDMMPGYEVGDVPGVTPATPRTNWWVALGAGCLWPWRNAAASMEII